MTKESVFSILRFALTAVGAYLVGKNFFGSPIDNEVWQGIMGAILTLIGVIWGIMDKSATVEAVQSGLRSVITFVGVGLVGAGVIKDELLQAILGIIAVVVPVIYSQTSKVKNKEIATGEVRIADLSGVNPKTITPDTTPVKTSK